MKTSLQITDTSLHNFINSIDKNKNKVVEDARQFMRTEAEQLVSKIKDNTPRKTNALAESTKFRFVGTINNISYLVSTGNETRNPNTGLSTSSYALKVHEDPTGKGYKFFDNAVEDYKEIFYGNLSNHFKNNLTGGL